MTMRERWERFAEAPVGKRFQARFHGNDRNGVRWFLKPLTLVVGSLILVAGLFMLIAPGPGFLAFILGAALLAQESIWTARLMDACDLHGRRLFAAAGRGWHAASLWLKGLIVFVLLAAMAGFAALGWYLWQEYL